MRRARFVIVLSALLSTTAHATPTAPSLVVHSVDATRGEAGTLLRIAGVFPYGDLVQQPYPLQVFVRETTEGTRFLCFPLSGTPFEGNSPALAEGLDTESLWEMLEAAVPSPDARLLHLGPRRIEVLLPPSFPIGPAEAQLFVIYEGAPVFSNVREVDLPRSEP